MTAVPGRSRWRHSVTSSLGDSPGTTVTDSYPVALSPTTWQVCGATCHLDQPSGSPQDWCPQPGAALRPPHTQSPVHTLVSSLATCRALPSLGSSCSALETPFLSLRQAQRGAGAGRGAAPGGSEGQVWRGHMEYPGSSQGLVAGRMWR